MEKLSDKAIQNVSSQYYLRGLCSQIHTPIYASPNPGVTSQTNSFRLTDTLLFNSRQQSMPMINTWDLLLCGCCLGRENDHLLLQVKGWRSFQRNAGGAQLHWLQLLPEVLREGEEGVPANRRKFFSSSSKPMVSWGAQAECSPRMLTQTCTKQSLRNISTRDPSMLSFLFYMKSDRTKQLKFESVLHCGWFIQVLNTNLVDVAPLTPEMEDLSFLFIIQSIWVGCHLGHLISFLCFFWRSFATWRTMCNVKFCYCRKE